MISRLAISPLEFRNELVIDSDAGSFRLADLVERWQAADFAAIDPALMDLAGIAQAPPVIRRIWMERPRGHSKTSDIAIVVSWLLAFAPKMLTGIVAAADRDQAALLREAIARLVRQNDWLSERLEVNRMEIKNNQTGSTLRIISNDVHSSYGALCDFIVADELTHWGDDRSLFDSLLSTAAKKEKCLLMVITNAGFGMNSSWQWTVREAIREAPDWRFSRLDGPQASWIGEAKLAEQRRLLPTAAYRRLWLNQWVSTSGDALEEADIQAAIVTGMHPMGGTDRGWGFIAGLDLGIKRDHSALVTIGCDFNRQPPRLRTADVQSWAPGDGGQVDLTQVRAAVLDKYRTFGLSAVMYDPHQCELMAQDLRKEGVNCIAVPFVGKNLNVMATAVLQAFRERTIDLLPVPALIADLQKLTIVQNNWGFKLEAPADAAGHADRAIALALALPTALDWVAQSAVPSDDFGPLGTYS